MNEADTCRKFVVPKLQAAGWDNEPHSIAEQRTITDGRIVPVGKGFVRKSPKRADYILRYERNFSLAVVEAKADWKTAGQGIQQAKEYAELLQLKFAYATNGEEIVEFDYFTGTETIVQSYPTPAALWARYSVAKKIPTQAGAQMLTPMNHLSGKGERYYQEIAVNRAVEGILTGQRLQLLTMATGTGKTAVSFQICWKLWSAMWNRTQCADTLSAATGERDGVRCRTAPEHRKPKILFLADRNILVDDPMGKDFTPLAMRAGNWKAAW